MTPSTNSWTSIAWGGPAGHELFVAVAQSGTGNRVMTSPDGISWTSRNSVADNRWLSVVWGGPAGQELFVAVAQNASQYSVMTSPDGINWTGQDAGINLNLKTVTWGGRPGEEVFVALDQADVGIGNNSITSPDGIHWTTRSVGISSINWHDITWGGPLGKELFVAVANRTNPVGPTLMYSSDGINWNFLYDINERFKSITWGGPTGQERFVAVGHNQLHMLSSFDGITWTKTYMEREFRRSWTSVNWGGPIGQERYLAVAIIGAPKSVMSSPDGVTWTMETGIAINGWSDVAWGGPQGQGRFVAVSSETITEAQVMTLDIIQTTNSWTTNPVEQQTYTGSPITPTINVIDGSVQLTENTDFTVAYANNTNTGTAGVTITGIGVYSGTITQTFAITAKTLTVTAYDIQKVYDGQPSTGWTATYQGFVPGENELNLTGALTFSGIGTTATDIGSYPITPFGFSSNNYDLNFVDGVVSITPLTVTVSPDVLSKTYGEVDPVLTYTLSSTSSAALSVVGKLSRASGEDVGEYTIELGTLSNTNYTLNLAVEDFEIIPLAVMVTPDALSKTYGEDDPLLTYTLSATSSATLGVSGDLSRDAGEDVGDYAIRLGTLSNTNYILNLAAEDFEIIPLVVDVIPNVLSKTYGEADPLLTYTLSTTSSATLGVSGDLSRDAGEDVGD